MNKLILTSAIGLTLLAAPAVAQDRSNSAPGAGVESGAGTTTGTGTGRMGDPSNRVRPETERSRSFDKQRSTPPMTTDPRLGPSGGEGIGTGSRSASPGGRSSGGR